VANSTHYGNGAHIAPGAELDDGQLDLVGITTSNPVFVLELVVRLFAGNIDRGSHVVTISSSRFEIVRETSGPVHTNGEIHEMDRKLEIEILPMSLNIAVPGDAQQGKERMSGGNEENTLAAD
jgi:diacylglycerol kinase (ATP)